MCWRSRMKLKFRGVFCPLITPFKFDGTIYKEGVKNLIDFLVEKGVDGLFVCGTFGLGPAMTIEERKKMVEYTVEFLDRRLDVIVQVGSSNMEACLELAKHAEDVGVGAVASTPLFYYRYRDEDVLNFFMKLSSHINTPVFIYNIPSRVGYEVSVELLEKLVEKGVSGMKDSGNDVLKSYEYICSAKKKNPDFKFLIGTEALMLPTIIAGADGCVSGLSNIYPEVVVKLYKLLEEGKIREAVNLHYRIVEARKILENNQPIQSCYEILKLRGVDVGYPKPILKPVSRTIAEEMKIKIERLVLTNEK